MALAANVTGCMHDENCAPGPANTTRNPWIATGTPNIMCTCAHQAVQLHTCGGSPYSTLAWSNLCSALATCSPCR